MAIMLKAVTPRTTAHLLEWCRKWQLEGTPQNGPDRRFGIAVYQISQGLGWWRQGCAAPLEVSWQSYASCAMHLAMLAEAVGVDLSGELPEEIDGDVGAFKGWEHFVLALGRVQQMVIYMQDAGATTRRSRYSADEMRDRIGEMARQALALVPPGRREEMLHAEMLIMTKDLTRKGTNAV